MLKDTSTLCYTGIVHKVWSDKGINYAELKTDLKISKGIDFKIDTIHINQLFYTCGEGAVLSDDGKTVINNHKHRVEEVFRFKKNDTLLVFSSKEKKNEWIYELKSFKLNSSNNAIIDGLQAYFKENDNLYHRKAPLTLNFPSERIYLGPYHVNWQVYFPTDISKGTQQRFGFSFDPNTKKVIREIAYNIKGQTEYLYEFTKNGSNRRESFFTRYKTIDSLELPIYTQHCIEENEVESKQCITSAYTYYENKQLKSLEHFGDKSTLRCKISFNPNGSIQDYYVNNNQHLKFSISPNGKIIYQGEKRIYDEKNIK